MLRLGIVGVNGIGQAHAWACKSVDTVALAAVCDIDAGRADKAASDFDVRAFTDPVAMYASDLVDAVVIATPAGTHAPLMRDAIAAGMHVYCEKPIAPTSDEGYALADAARDANVVLQVGFQMRWHAGYRALRDAYAGLGELRRATMVANNWFRPQAYFEASPWRATWRMAGGGVLMNQAVHQLDALINTVGMPNRVTAQARTRAHAAEVEDEAYALLEWPGGARGTLVASLNEISGREYFEIVCEGGAVTLADGYDVNVATHANTTDAIAAAEGEYASFDAAWRNIEVPRRRSEEFDMFCAAQRDFAAAVSERRAPIVDAVSGTRSVELANAIYLSALEDTSVELPVAPGVYGPVFDELVAGRRLRAL
jgi:predicted dehydrogenase